MSRKYILQSPFLSRFIKLTKKEGQRFMEGYIKELNLDGSRRQEEIEWYEFTELGGLDFMFEYRFDVMVLGEEILYSNSIKFNYINGLIEVITLDLDRNEFIKRALKQIPQLKTRIPDFDTNCFNPKDKTYSNSDASVIKSISKIRPLTSVDLLLSSLCPIDEYIQYYHMSALDASYMLEYIVQREIRNNYSQIKIPIKDVEKWFEDGWILMTPEKDMFDLVELFLIQTSQGANAKRLFIRKERNCVGIHMEPNGKVRANLINDYSKTIIDPITGCIDLNYPQVRFSQLGNQDFYL